MKYGVADRIPGVDRNVDSNKLSEPQFQGYKKSCRAISKYRSYLTIDDILILNIID